MPDDDHYLRQELYDLVKTDAAIFDFLQQGSLDGVWYWDLDRPEHEWMSPRFWDVLGYDPVGMPHDPASWQDIIDQDDLKTALANFQRHCGDAAHPYDQIVRYRHREGHTVTIRCRGIAIRDGEGRPIRMLGAHNDISEFIEARDAERGKERAEAASLSKTIFLGNISHEIRTPLNSMIVIADALRATEMTLKQSHMLDDMLLAADQLQSLLSDLIDISRIEAGEISMEFQAFSSREIVEDVAATFVGAAAEKGVSLQVQTTLGAPPVVYGATKRIRQVVINLVSNAIKFTASGSVTVACDARPEGEGEGGDTILSIRVSDTGPGVPDAIKDMIFDRFERSDESREMEVPGVGIGLTISKVLCRLHGGALHVGDTPGGGATFTATFRVRVADEEEEAGRVGAPDPKPVETLPKGLRIFVAEDVFLNRRALRHLLEPLGVALAFATNGPDALEMMRKTEFDVALVDLRMPGMSGLDVIRLYREIEAEGGRARRPVVACSAHATAGETARYLESGFDDFLPKPFKARELIAIIRSVL